MNSCCLLVLSLYPDLFDPFRRMIDDLQPDTYKILVRSGTDIKTPSDYHWLDDSRARAIQLLAQCEPGIRSHDQRRYPAVRG